MHAGVVVQHQSGVEEQDEAAMQKQEPARQRVSP